MAAHIVTVFKQFDENPDNVLPYMKDGLGYAPWGRLLTTNDWVALNAALDQDRQSVIAMMAVLRPTYTTQWENLGQPANYEDWAAKVAALSEKGELA
jgi:hypothetical protein